MAWWNWWTRWLNLHRDHPEDPLAQAEAEFRELLNRELPELEVERDDEDGSLLLFHSDDDPIRMNLPRMAGRMDPDATPEERQATYAGWIEVLRQASSESEVTAEWSSKLLMRLVTPSWVNQAPPMLVRRVPGLGLYAAPVFDFPTNVRYVTREDLADLGMTEDEVHAVALDNLRERMPASLVRDQLEKDGITRYVAMDTYEAARILLIPSLLEAGEAVGVAIPDLDSLVLFPADADPDTVRSLAHCDHDEALLTRGVRVTEDGFELL